MAFCIVLLLFSTGTSGLIIGYLQSKSLAQSTPYDSVFISMLYAQMFAFGLVCVINTVASICAPVNPQLADTVSRLVYLSIVSFLSCGLHCFLIRHLTIFHSTMMDQVPDHVIVFGFRASCAFIVSLVFYVDSQYGAKGGIFFKVLTIGSKPDLSNSDYGIAPSFGMICLAASLFMFSTGILFGKYCLCLTYSAFSRNPNQSRNP